MNDKSLYEILKTKEYYNIVVLIMACEVPSNQKPLQEWLGVRGSFDAMRRTIEFSKFARDINLSNNPIALTPCGHIYKDHHQINGATVKN